MEDDITLKTPWGELKKSEGPRAAVRLFMKQIHHMISHGECANIDYAHLDIKGYKVLLNEATDNTIRRFLVEKRKAKEQGRKFANNIVVIDHLKRSGLWEGK